MKDMMDTDILRRIALWNARNGGSRSGDTSGSGENPFADGGTDGYGIVRSAVTDTFYNMISDGTFVAGTDASSSAYAAYTATDLSSTWSGKALNSVSATGKTYVRSLGGYYVAFVKDSECVEFWGNSSGSVSSGGVHVRDFIYAGSTIYRLSYSITDGVTTYAVHSMTDPTTTNTLVYSTTDDITWIASNGSSLLVVINDKIYMVTSATEITSVYETLSNGSGIIKLIAHGFGYIAISKMGNYAYCTTSETVWFTRRLGNYRFADVCSTGSVIYLINKDGQIYSGASPDKLTMLRRFSTDPISINFCGMYLVVTYEGKIEYMMYQSMFLLKDSGFSTTYKIIKILYFENMYYVLLGSRIYANITSLYRGSSLNNLTAYLSGVMNMNISADGEKLYLLTYTSTDVYVKYIQDGTLATFATINTTIKYYDVWSTANGNVYLYASTGYIYKYNTGTNVFDSLVQHNSYENKYFSSCYNPNTDAWYLSWQTGWSTYYEHEGWLKNDTWTEFASSAYGNAKNIGDYVYRGSYYINGYIYRGRFVGSKYGGSSVNLNTITYGGSSIPVSDADYCNGLWIAACVDGYIYASSDKNNWTRVFYDSRLVMSLTYSNYRENANSFYHQVVGINNKLVIPISLYNSSTGYEYRILVGE